MAKIKNVLKLEQPTISGLKIITLKQFYDKHGAVLHMLRSDSKHFKQFGEIYFSEINPGCTKTWKNHSEMIQNFTVPIGKVLFKFYDDRPTSKSFGVKEKIIVGRPDNYHLIIIPPLIWYSFENISKNHSLIANCASIPHNPNELKKDKPKIIDF
tara:strand:- start:476 stop:940 length:465 start_codon:yes stop_codon:yes gene_type:complete